MSIVKEYRNNDDKKISIAQGNEFAIDTDIMVCAIDELTNEQQQKAFISKYGEDMFDYIRRNEDLASCYFYTPGFKFRANFVYFLIKTKIKSKDSFIDTLANIHRHAEENFLENITFSLEQINQLNCGEKRKTVISQLIEYIFTDQFTIKATLIDNMKYNVEKQHDNLFKKHKMETYNSKTFGKKVKEGDKILKDAKQKKIINGDAHEKFDEPNELLNIQGDLFVTGNMINILNDIVSNLDHN